MKNNFTITIKIIRQHVPPTEMSNKKTCDCLNEEKKMKYEINNNKQRK